MRRRRRSASSSIAAVPAFYPKLGLDPLVALTPVSLITDIPISVSVRAKHPLRDLAELITRAKSAPGKLTFGSGGVGTGNHLAGELLNKLAGISMLHVPFRGTPEGMTEVIAGRIDMYPAPAVNAITLTKEGKVNSLAVSSAKRLPLMPDVRTVAEFGLPDAEYNFWVGAFLPARTPKPIVDRLNTEIVAALKVKDVADKIIALGGDPSPMTPGEFDAFVRKEIALNGEIVKASGYQPQ